MILEKGWDSKEIKTLMEACLKADQRNGPCIMLTVLFKFNYCLLLLLSPWVLIFLEKPYVGSLLGPFFRKIGILLGLFFAQWVLLINWLHCKCFLGKV